METEVMYKEVRFDRYCKFCIYKNKHEHEKPCCDCLCEPVNLYSERPVKFESKLEIKK